MLRPGNCPKHGRLVLQCPFFLIAPCYLRCMAYSSGQCLLNSHKLWHSLCNRLEHKLKQSWRRRSCGWKMRWTLQRLTCCTFSLTCPLPVCDCIPFFSYLLLLFGMEQAAVEEGIVVGGGCALLRLSSKVDAIKDTLENYEQKVCYIF